MKLSVISVQCAHVLFIHLENVLLDTIIVVVFSTRNQQCIMYLILVHAFTVNEGPELKKNKKKTLINKSPYDLCSRLYFKPYEALCDETVKVFTQK